MAIRPVTVSELNRYIKDVLTSDPVLSNVIVRGEISSWKGNARSGAIFFSIKDENSQIDCVLWQDAASRLTVPFGTGDMVNIHGRIDYWNNRGQIRLHARYLEAAGEGALNAKYEELKQRLQAEGLFDADRKKVLPSFPKNVFVVTSAEGSAVEDIKKTIIEKNDYVNIYVVPVKVQGQGAAEDIATAISRVNTLYMADVMIVARGGGSPEERWAFNEEIVARSISDSQIPIVTGIGHEDNESLADLAADHYAKTPTAAAEAAVPDTFEIREDMAYSLELLERNFERYMHAAKERVEFLSPSRMVGMLRNMLALRSSVCDIALQNTRTAASAVITREKSSTEIEMARLEALSPKNIMARGYGALQNASGAMIKDIGDVGEAENISITLKDGKILATVYAKRRD